ncbi:TPA: hypothetical protein ACOGBH_002870, partial [Staphylococcus aureus]
LVVMFFLILLICYKITVMICRYFSKE